MSARLRAAIDELIALSRPYRIVVALFLVAIPTVFVADALYRWIEDSGENYIEITLITLLFIPVAPIIVWDVAPWRRLRRVK